MIALVVASGKSNDAEFDQCCLRMKLASLGLSLLLAKLVRLCAHVRYGMARMTPVRQTWLWEQPCAQHFRSV